MVFCETVPFPKSDSIVRGGREVVDDERSVSFLAEACVFVLRSGGYLSWKHIARSTLMIAVSIKKSIGELGEVYDWKGFISFEEA